MVGDFSIPPSMKGSFRQKLGKETDEWNKGVEQMDLTDIHRTSNPIPEEYTCFSSAQGISSRIDPLLVHKTSLSKFKSKIIPSIFSDDNGMKPEISNSKKTGKFTNIWKLNNVHSRSLGQGGNQKGI